MQLKKSEKWKSWKINPAFLYGEFSEYSNNLPCQCKRLHELSENLVYLPELLGEFSENSSNSILSPCKRGKFWGKRQKKLYQPFYTCTAIFYSRGRGEYFDNSILLPGKHGKLSEYSEFSHNLGLYTCTATLHSRGKF